MQSCESVVQAKDSEHACVLVYLLVCARVCV